MSDAASLPETLEGTIVHNTRTRQDNWPTDTRRGNYIAPQRALLDKIDTVQATIDSIKTALMQTCSPVSTNKLYNDSSVFFIKTSTSRVQGCFKLNNLRRSRRKDEP